MCEDYMEAVSLEVRDHQAVRYAEMFSVGLEGRP